MAIKPSLKSIANTKKEVKERLQKRAGITHWSQDGVAASLVDSMAAEQRLIQNRSANALKAIQIATATGQALEALGANRGISRLAPSKASSGAAERNFYFYSDTTFGDLNGGADIVIPKGTLITPGDSLTPGRVIELNQQIVYETAAEYTLPAGGSKVYCGVKAKTPGSLQNVGESVLITHNFVGYTASATNGLKCLNTYSIINGRNKEDDEKLRFRIANHYAALAGATEDALNLHGLTVPGVLETRVVPNYYGIGSAAVFVFGIDEESNLSMVNKVQTRINSVQTAGIKIIASPGVKVSFDFDLLFYVQEDLSSAQRSATRRAIVQVLNDFFSRRSNSPTRNVSLSAIASALYSKPLVRTNLSRKSSLEELFNNVHIRKNYSGTRVASERVTLDSMNYGLEVFEFATLGAVNIRLQNISLNI